MQTNPTSEIITSSNNSNIPKHNLVPSTIVGKKGIYHYIVTNISLIIEFKPFALLVDFKGRRISSDFLRTNATANSWILLLVLHLESA